VKANVESRGLVDSLSYWTFTDVFEERGAGATVFHGGFGLINYQGVAKPTFHAYRFLNALGDETLSAVDGAIVTRHRTTGRITALIYHYPHEVKMSLPAVESRAAADEIEALGAPRCFTVEISGLRPHANVQIEMLDKDHGNALAAWRALGEPEPPTREQIAELRSGAMATQREVLQADQSGRFVLRRTITPWSVVLIDEQERVSAGNPEVVRRISEP
jgi:xylan 1,4-beta-xylosidase